MRENVEGVAWTGVEVATIGMGLVLDLCPKLVGGWWLHHREEYVELQPHRQSSLSNSKH